MANKAFVHSSLEGFKFPPNDLVIVGHDTDDGSEHDYYRADCNDPVSESLYESVKAVGIIRPIRVVKIDERKAYVGVGRSVTKVARRLEKEGHEIVVPALVYPKGTTMAEIMRTANAENHVRKIESLKATIEHVFMSVRSLGGDSSAMKKTAIDFAIPVPKVKLLLAMREHTEIVTAVDSGALGQEKAFAIISLPQSERAAEFKRALENPQQTYAEVRERSNRIKQAAKAEAAAAEAPAADGEPGENAVTFEQIANGEAPAVLEQQKQPPKQKQKPSTATSFSSATIRKIAALEDDKLGDLDVAFRDAARVFAGKLGSDTVEGLDEHLRAFGVLA